MAVDYLIQTGDIANRMEIPYQSAAASWAQFEEDYMHGVTLKNHQNQSAQTFVAKLWQCMIYPMQLDTVNL